MTWPSRRTLADRVASLESDSAPDGEAPNSIDNLDWVPGRPPELTREEKRVLDEANDVTPPTQVEWGRP